MQDIHTTCYEVAEEYGTPGNYLDGANIAGFLNVTHWYALKANCP